MTHMSQEWLPSVDYEPPGEPSLFERWEAGDETPLLAPLSVRDTDYRKLIVRLLSDYFRREARLISVGAGNGFVESELAGAGWVVLATDPAKTALRLLQEKGLVTAQFRLLRDPPPGLFDTLYCDGVMGHLWDPVHGMRLTWSALAGLLLPGGVALVANDLADDDESPQFSVRSSTSARFFRPPAGRYGEEAQESGRWGIESSHIYAYTRRGAPRRREIVVARLLVNERIETQDGS